MANTLAELEAQLAWEQQLYAYPERVWPVTRTTDGGDAVLDVAIIGGGQAGTATAVALLRERITNFLVLDENPEGEEGPWMTYARMITLRTDKNLHGPDAGFPSATFRAWYVAQFGMKSWDDMSKIPKDMWMGYLRWIRRMFDLPVRNTAKVVRVVPHAVGFQLEVRTADGPITIYARKVVATTGLAGAGGPRVPALAERIGRGRWAHSMESLDEAKLVDRRVAVLGGNASAFDNAAAALIAGASTVTQFIRRPKHPELNTLRYLEFVGLFRNFAMLDDQAKLAITRRTLEQAVPPPPYSIDRCTAYANYDLRMGSGWTDLVETDAGVTIVLADGSRTEVDYIVFGTGFAVDLSRVGYLADLHDRVRLWRDQVALNDDPIDAEIGGNPYLSEHMQLMGRTAADTAVLGNFYMMNGGSMPSIGPVWVGVNGMPFAVRRLVAGLSESLFLDDSATYLSQFGAFEHSEFSAYPGKVANG